MDINDPSQITKKIYISQGTPTEYKYIQVFIAPNYITLNRRWQMRPRGVRLTLCTKATQWRTLSLLHKAFGQRATCDKRTKNGTKICKGVGELKQSTPTQYKIITGYPINCDSMEAGYIYINSHIDIGL